MKFTWGTGILIFLIVFLGACAVFIVFASRQQVNLVHKDYYEKGVDYSQQMKVDARSKPFARSINTSISNNTFVVKLADTLAEKIDSGSILMFRPSDKTKDITMAVAAGMKQFEFDKSELINGRYILKFTWYTNGIKYEIDKPVNVQ